MHTAVPSKTRSPICSHVAPRKTPENRSARFPVAHLMRKPTRMPPASDLCGGGSIVDRFEQVVDQRAGRVAVRSRRELLTYSQLDQWANQIALSIVNGTTGTDGPVGLLL